MNYFRKADEQMIVAPFCHHIYFYNLLSQDLCCCSCN